MSVNDWIPVGYVKLCTHFCGDTFCRLLSLSRQRNLISGRKLEMTWDLFTLPAVHLYGHPTRLVSWWYAYSLVCTSFR